LYELAKAFIEDPEGTISVIADALGDEFATLVECGSFERGRLLGENVNPTFMLRLATKLAQYPDLPRALKETKKDYDCTSFTAGTTILTSTGNIRIENLKVGDYVKSRNEGSFFDSDQLVTHLHTRIAKGYHRIQTEFGVINATPEHPFWVQGKGWVNAEELNRADPITTIDGDVLVYQNDYLGSSVKVYNFTVDKTHNYFVGSFGVWVHNAELECDIPTPLVRGIEQIREYSSYNAARGAGRLFSGLGDEAIDFVQEIGPHTGSVTGRMSADGLRGWRIDYDPSKGFHVNWWDRTGGPKRKDWLYGANKIVNGTEDDFLQLIQHFPK